MAVVMNDAKLYPSEDTMQHITVIEIYMKTGIDLLQMRKVSFSLIVSSARTHVLLSYFHDPNHT